jgi:hypothetical protein
MKHTLCFVIYGLDLHGWLVSIMSACFKQLTANRDIIRLQGSSWHSSKGLIFRWGGIRSLACRSSASTSMTFSYEVFEIAELCSMTRPKAYDKRALAIRYEIGVGSLNGRDGGSSLQSSSKSSSYKLLGSSVSLSLERIMLGSPTWKENNRSA